MELTLYVTIFFYTSYIHANFSNIRVLALNCTLTWYFNINFLVENDLSELDILKIWDATSLTAEQGGGYILTL